MKASVIILVLLSCMVTPTARAHPTSVYGGAFLSGPGFYINSNGRFFTGIHLYMNPYSSFRVAATRPVVPTNDQTLQNVMEYAEIKRITWLESKKTALLPPPAPVPYIPLDIPPLTTSEKE